MNRFRIKTITLALVTILVGSNTVFAFSDTDKHWAEKNIEYLHNKKIISGYPDNSFNPEGYITREEAAVIISRLKEEKVSDNKCSGKSLVDIEDRWSTDSIKYLLDEGIIDGYDDGTFRPQNNITRAEFVKLVYSYLEKHNGIDVIENRTHMTDIKGNWAEKYIHILMGMEVISGYPDGTFKPDNNITRAEAVTIVSNILLKYEDIDLNFTEEEKKEEIISMIEANYPGIFDINHLRTLSVEEIFEFMGDEHSIYMDINDFQNWKSNLKGEFVGIGVHLTCNKDDKIEVLYIVDDSPADKAGIKAGDIIESVDGKKYEGYEVFKVTKKIAGVPGTKVKLEITTKDNDGKEIKKTKTIERVPIKLETVFTNILNEDVGYIRITKFENPTFSDYIKAVEDLKSKGAKSLVIDLRYNGGGTVESARGVADSLIDSGNLYSVVKTDGTTNYIQASPEKLDIPVAIVVNSDTASASELVASSAKDHGAAIIVGKKTYGKGTIQKVVSLQDGSGFKLTIGEYFSPNGNKIHGVGVLPDIDVEAGNFENIGPGYLEYDYQLQKAIEVIKQ